jgi:hypothetical protein
MLRPHWFDAPGHTPVAPDRDAGGEPRDRMHGLTRRATWEASCESGIVMPVRRVGGSVGERHVGYYNVTTGIVRRNQRPSRFFRQTHDCAVVPAVLCSTDC